MQYLIPKATVIFEEEIKKSRFITYLSHKEGLEESRAYWQQLREEHPQARHHCWATVAGRPNDSMQYGFSDDGEPSGTAGKPMLSSLIGSNVGEIAAVVVRYYGGIQLGTGGLVKAYGNGVREALKLLQTQLKIEREQISLTCDYGQLNLVQQLIDLFDAQVLRQDFSDRIYFVLAVEAQQISPFSQQLTDRSSGALHLVVKEYKK